MACENEFQEDLDNLRKLFSSKNIVFFTIDNIKCMAGSSSGDNYMSVVKRVHINTESSAKSFNNKNGSGSDLDTLSVIIKRQIPSLSRRQFFRCDEAFNNEINAYTSVVPLLEEYTTEPLFPKCFYAGADDVGEIIMLEDLKTLGYCMQNRLTGLDINYCELVMKELARLHAASIAAKQLDNARFREQKSHIREIVYCKEAEEFYRNILESAIQESLSSLRKSNVDGCLTEPIRLIEKLQSTLFLKIQDFIVNSKESLNVICHGDLWVNNIMFKNTTHQTETLTSTPNANTSTALRACAVKFFDLQAMRYTSPVFDLLHFIYTSTKRDLRDSSIKSLLRIYSLELMANLEVQFTRCSSQYDLAMLRNTFSLRNITTEYYKHVLYGLAISMWILPAVTFDPNNIPNLDQISETTPNPKEIKCTQKLTQEYHSRMKELALEFYQNGFLTNNCNKK